MNHNRSFCVVFVLGVFSAGQLSSQVLSRGNSGFTSPEWIQAPPFTATDSISTLSAQDVTGDGRLDLLVTGPTGGVWPGPITSVLLQNKGNKNFAPVAGSNSSYCAPAFGTINNSTGFCTLADLNGDGQPDRIYAEAFTDPVNGAAGELDYPEITVELATGPTTYAAPLRYVLGGKSEFISAIATGDFNGDGRMDIAVLTMSQLSPPNVPFGTPSQMYGGVVVLDGNSDGGFTISQRFLTPVFQDYNFSYTTDPYLPAAPYLQLTALDLNGDGKSDLIVYENSSFGSNGDTVTAYFGGVDGLYAGPAGSSAGGSYFQAMLAGNLHGDGVRDVLELANDGSVHVLWGGGLNSPDYAYFTHDQKLVLNEYEPNVVGLGIRDLNGDGRMDVVVTTTSFLNIYLQGDDGTFSDPKQYPLPGAGYPGNYTSYFAIGDFDGDGHLDIAVPSSPIAIYYGDGHGSFSGSADSSFPGPQTANTYYVEALVTGDFNRDGRADIAALGPSNNVVVFPGSGQGWFQPPASYPITTAATPLTLATGDVNGDGILDLVTSMTNETAGSADTYVFLGKADGTFAPAKGYALGVTGNYLLLRDVNNDGKLDIVSVAGVNLGNGNGTFGDLIPFPVALPPFCCAIGISVGDFNHDGKLDVAYSEEGAIYILLGDGKGNFTLKQTLSPPCGEGCNYPLLSVGDLNGDGVPDIAASISISAGTGVVVYLANGDGTFREGATAKTSPNYNNGPVAIEDCNGDGNNDIVVGQGSDIAVLLNKGGGVLAAPVFFANGEGGSFAFADYNSDGALDIAASTVNGFARVLNTGYKTWPKPASLPTAPTLPTSSSE